jgi:hypothetical protein
VTSLKEGDREALVAAALAAAQKPLGVAQLEAQADDSRHRRQSNVALVEGRAHAELAATLLNDPVRADQGGGVGTRLGPREAEAGDESPVGEPR